MLMVCRYFKIIIVRFSFVPILFISSGGGVFFKLLGVTTLTTGGVGGYAWFDQSFRKTIEDNVPYSKDAFDYIFPYLPDPPKSQAPM